MTGSVCPHPCPVGSNAAQLETRNLSVADGPGEPLRHTDPDLPSSRSLEAQAGPGGETGRRGGLKPPFHSRGVRVRTPPRALPPTRCYVSVRRRLSGFRRRSGSRKDHKIPRAGSGEVSFGGAPPVALVGYKCSCGPSGEGLYCCDDGKADTPVGSREGSRNSFLVRKSISRHAG